MAEYIEREADGFKYYVVRNKATGLYFRGKGENKWGKYYNQASVYRFKKHAENAVEEETRRGNPTEVVEIRIVEATADVVEVRRGEWIETTEPMGWHDVDCIECTACHESWIEDDDFDIDDYKMFWNFCPNCGADMRGNNNDNRTEN